MAANGAQKSRKAAKGHTGGATDQFMLPVGRAGRDGWTTQADGSIERGGGPLVMRVEPSKQGAGSGWLWRLLIHSWVEPATVEVDSGVERHLYVAKAQVFWAAYAWLHVWLRSLTDDGMI